jgi:hypothetical protein
MEQFLTCGCRTRHIERGELQGQHPDHAAAPRQPGTCLNLRHPHMHALTCLCRPSGPRPRPSPPPLRPKRRPLSRRSRSRRRLRRSPRPSKRRHVPGLLIVITPGLLGKSLGGNGVFGAWTGDPSYLCMFTADTQDLGDGLSRKLGVRGRHLEGFFLPFSECLLLRLLTGEDRPDKK